MTYSIEPIIGKIPKSISVNRSDSIDYNPFWGDYILFTFTDGTTCRFYHQQDCCESVDIEDITGDFSDLIGYPLLVAEVRTNEQEGLEWDIGLWTFYCFRNLGGSVDVRWYGTSNGYYSVEVNMEIEDKKE